MEKQLLYSPIQDFGDVKLILSRARHLVNPAELFQLAPHTADRSEHLAIQRKLVNAPRVGIGTVKILRRTGRNTDCPRRAWRHGGVRSRGIRIRWVTHPHMNNRWYRHIDLDLAQESSIRIEHLNAAIASIGDVDIP